MFLNGEMNRDVEHFIVGDASKELPEGQSFEEMLKKVGKNKDKEAFIALFKYFAPRIKSYLIKGGTDERSADELAQETMLAVWDKAKSYNSEQARASTWIFTIARNKRIDHLRKVSRTELDYNDAIHIPDEKNLQTRQLQKAEENEILEHAIKKLPEEQAMLLRKSFYEDKPHSEIARETNIPLGTVKSRIRLALERLRQQTRVKSLWN